nr:unnamed protein product [Callosobruchus chinensis]
MTAVNLPNWFKKNVIQTLRRVVEANHLSRLDKSFTLTIPNIEMWKRGEIQFPEEALVCYTDGSRLASGQASGAGMYVENRGVRESYSLGTNTTIFEAEVYAILSAACNEESKTQQISIAKSVGACRLVSHTLNTHDGSPFRVYEIPALSQHSPSSKSLISLAAWIPSSLRFFSICLLLARAALSSAEEVHPILQLPSAQNVAPVCSHPALKKNPLGPFTALPTRFATT